MELATTAAFAAALRDFVKPVTEEQLVILLAAYDVRTYSKIESFNQTVKRGVDG